MAKANEHYSYSQIVKAAESAKTHPYGYRYVLIVLAPGDTIDNPASTKHVHTADKHGGVWLWEIHATGVTARVYDSVGGISQEVRDGCARLGKVAVEIEARVIPSNVKAGAYDVAVTAPGALSGTGIPLGFDKPFAEAVMRSINDNAQMNAMAKA